MYDYEIVEESFRVDGYYTIKVTCDNGYHIECVYGKRQPSEAFKIREIERRVLKLEYDINNPPAEPE